LDEVVEKEVLASLNSGVIPNAGTDLKNRFLRQLGRQTTKTRQIKEAKAADEETRELAEELEKAKDAEKEAAERRRELTAQLKAQKKPKASSSGRVQQPKPQKPKAKKSILVSFMKFPRTNPRCSRHCSFTSCATREYNDIHKPSPFCHRSHC
jgi:hypothetical protein